MNNLHCNRGLRHHRERRIALNVTLHYIYGNYSILLIIIMYFLDSFRKDQVSSIWNASNRIPHRPRRRLVNKYAEERVLLWTGLLNKT